MVLGAVCPSEASFCPASTFSTASRILFRSAALMSLGPQGMRPIQRAPWKAYLGKLQIVVQIANSDGIVLRLKAIAYESNCSKSPSSRRSRSCVSLSLELIGSFLRSECAAHACRLWPGPVAFTPNQTHRSPTGAHRLSLEPP